MWRYTNDLGEGFFSRLAEECEVLGCKKEDVLGVMQSESGVRPTAVNPTSRASGLIQFMPATLLGLGWVHGPEAFRRTTAEQQLDYVRRYFWPHRGRLTSPGMIYTAVFLPALLAKASRYGADFVLCAREGPLSWAFTANAYFDFDKNYAITVRELTQSIRRSQVGPRWEEIYKRATGETWPVNDKAVDLGSVAGIQSALQALGFDPGPIDGLVGSLTVTALRAYQATRGLRADGIAGPLTMSRLRSDFAEYLAR